MKFKLLVLILIFLMKTSFGQTTPQDICNKFFATYKLGDTDKAIDDLFSISEYWKEKNESIENLKQQLKKSAAQIGKFYGADLIVSRTAGTNLMLLTYLVRHDREPFVFKILFYKPNDKWQLQNFNYGNSIDEELEEASKAYRIKENID
jgi:hypothetical protein